MINLPAGGIDRTDVMQIVAWMVVDGNQPSVVQFLSPDPLQLVQERDWKDLEFEIMVDENEGLDLDTLRLYWLIVPHGLEIPELALLGGNVSMELIAGTGAGSYNMLDGFGWGGMTPSTTFTMMPSNNMLFWQYPFPPLLFLPF